MNREEAEKVAELRNNDLFQTCPLRLGARCDRKCAWFGPSEAYEMPNEAWLATMPQCAVMVLARRLNRK